MQFKYYFNSYYFPENGNSRRAEMAGEECNPDFSRLKLFERIVVGGNLSVTFGNVPVFRTRGFVAAISLLKCKVEDYGRCSTNVSLSELFLWFDGSA